MYLYPIVLSEYLTKHPELSSRRHLAHSVPPPRQFARSGKLRTNTIMVLLLVSQNPIHFSRKEVLKAIKPVAII